MTKRYRYAPIKVKPQEEGGRATHGVLTVRAVPRVRILIVQDIPRVRNFTWSPSLIMKKAWKSTSNVIIALLLCAARSEGYYFGHLYSPQGGSFWYFWPIMLSQRWGIWLLFFFQKMSKSPPHARADPLLGKCIIVVASSFLVARLSVDKHS